uniref:Lysosomal protein transmembrane 5 n=1 Tax=Bos mutus grunniens TaxID=30521 RepID=A0A8B9YCH5_BOSMU
MTDALMTQLWEEPSPGPDTQLAPRSFPVSASEEGRQHHGPPRGRHPPDLLLLQCAHRYHRPGHLPCAELVSSFLLITMLFIISLSLLVGVVKNREKYLLPFLSLQIMDFLLCLLTLMGSYIELPAYLKFASRSSRRVSPSKVPLMTLQLLDFCLSILTLCSSYMEVPTYLNFKSMNHMNYLPSQDGMTHNQFIKMMIIFSIAFVTVLILKVYMFKCVWRCYRLMKCTNSAEERSGSKMLQKVVLPSYEEAVSLPYKVPWPG